MPERQGAISSASTTSSARVWRAQPTQRREKQSTTAWPPRWRSRTGQPPTAGSARSPEVRRTRSGAVAMPGTETVSRPAAVHDGLSSPNMLRAGIAAEVRSLLTDSLALRHKRLAVMTGRASAVSACTGTRPSGAPATTPTTCCTPKPSQARPADNAFPRRAPSHDMLIVAGHQQGRPLDAGHWSGIRAPVTIIDGDKSPRWIRNGIAHLAGKSSAPAT